MSDLKSELKEKVLPILNGSTGQPLSQRELEEWDNDERRRTGETVQAQQTQEREPMTAVTNTDRLYNFVVANPGRSGRFYMDSLSDINASSVSSLLTQLRTGGWLRSEGGRGNMVFFATDKPRTPRASMPEHVLHSLEKARAVRSLKSQVRKELKAKAKKDKAAAKAVQKQTPAPVQHHASQLLEVTRAEIRKANEPSVMRLDESFARTLRSVTAQQLIDMLGVRTAKELHRELSNIFG
jgi:hypothetical protein